MKRIDKNIAGWSDYQLLDSGEGRKLERFGTITIDRPDIQAIWAKSSSEKWLNSQAQFLWADKGERWKINKEINNPWNISWNNLKMTLSMKGFKHIGIFPEHREQWQEIQDLGNKNSDLKMLNLFGYTGAASIAAALSGMKVTHVDASRTTIETVKENAIQSGLSPNDIRVVCEDALRYTKRLVQREEKFDVIILDPPAFGRGPKGEVWKIENSLYELVSLLPKILSRDAKMVILNGYTSGFSALTFAEVLKSTLPAGEIIYGDIGIDHSDNSKTLSTGIYAQWRKI